MRYEERTLVALLCDRCGMRGPWAMYRKAAHFWAAVDGWKVEGDVALCPDCQEVTDEETQGRPDTEADRERRSDAPSR